MKSASADVQVTVPSSVGRGRVVGGTGPSVHDGLPVAFSDGVSIRLLAHELGAHAWTHTRAATGHHVTARALARTHGCAKYLPCRKDAEGLCAFLGPKINEESNMNES